MSLFVAGKPTRAAFSPKLSVNLWTRSRASEEEVSRATSTVQLPVAVHFLAQEVCTVLPFTVTEDNLGFDVVFGTPWQHWCSENKVPCPLPTLDYSFDIDFDCSSIDALNPNMISSSSSAGVDCQPPCSSRFTSRHPDVSPKVAESILEDMFQSRRVTGLRASIFRCSEQHLRKLCTLHGLDTNPRCIAKDLKVRLLYHIINGDCLAPRCEKTCPSPDRSACLSLSAGFPTPLSMTTFVVNLLSSSSPSMISTEDLLLVVESTGNQLPYQTSVNLRRRLCTSLQNFVKRCQQRLQRDPVELIL